MARYVPRKPLRRLLRIFQPDPNPNQPAATQYSALWEGFDQEGISTWRHRRLRPLQWPCGLIAPPPPLEASVRGRWPDSSSRVCGRDCLSRMGDREWYDRRDVYA